MANNGEDGEKIFLLSVPKILESLPILASNRLHFRMVNRVTHDFEEMIEGGGNVDTKSLSGGAKINTIFHLRFPGYLNEVGFEKLTQESEVYTAEINKI